jgi:hypothetical protein
VRGHAASVSSKGSRTTATRVKEKALLRRFANAAGAGAVDMLI